MTTSLSNLIDERLRQKQGRGEGHWEILYLEKMPPHKCRRNHGMRKITHFATPNVITNAGRIHQSMIKPLSKKLVGNGTFTNLKI